ncbi:MAG TPA: hypothetical protein VHB77_10980 [Planctomycetaceae bacterium]|nr:hypothetical protein [Planctomycetaceae bacterium]
MSDPAAEARAASPVSSGMPPEVRADASPGVRIDAPHRTSDATDSDQYDRHESEDLAVEALSEPAYGAPAFGSEPVPPMHQQEEMLLLQASQISEHLARRYAEIDRREQRIHTQLAELDQERRTVRLWVSQFEEQVYERDARIVERETACRVREAACDALEADIAEQRRLLTKHLADFEDERREQLAELERLQDDLSAQKRQQQLDLERQREELLAEHQQHLRELRIAQDDAERLKQTQAAEILQERALLENRARFHQEHLQKLRNEFEATQNAWQLERQGEQSRVAEAEKLAGLRHAQLDRFRALLEEREKSIERQADALARARRAAESACQQERETLRQDRQAWDREREVQSSELRRQQDLLSAHAESLETRRQRLDRLRTELEETHRQGLELRIAIEEASAGLIRQLGGPEAASRIELARSALAEQYRYAHESLAQQRAELEEARMQLHQQREQFRDERQTLADWMAQRDEQIRTGEYELQQREAAFSEREQAWLATRESWQHEKVQAEAIIRDLLRQLGDRGAGSPEIHSE